MLKNQITINNKLRGFFSDGEPDDNSTKKLIKIKFFNRSILVDGDKAGMDMFNQCAGTAFDMARHNIGELSDKEHKFISIEDLFSEEDKKKYPATNYKKQDEYKKFYKEVERNKYVKRESKKFDFISIDEIKKKIFNPFLLLRVKFVRCRTTA